jgi:GT2 family glycosyltransferase
MGSTLNSSRRDTLGVVVIGRNEAEQLARCLASVRAIPNCVYVDSGSTDASVVLARRERIRVVELSEPPHFTAARARNAGLAQLLTDFPGLEFVQMVDGDCEVRAGWIESALSALHTEPKLALVFGRMRERNPDLSIYNALCDDEWDVPIGDTTVVGGNALFRVVALRQVNFFNPTMIAGEDTELAIRLRKLGWRLRRIDAEMTLHDVGITRFAQWWRRMRRAGHAYGEMAFLHPDARDPNWPRSVRSIVFWGGAMPTALCITMAMALALDRRLWVAAVVLLLLWPLNMARLARKQRRRGLSAKVARASGILLMVAKLPQLIGLIGYHINRISGRTSRLIEYKRRKTA